MSGLGNSAMLDTPLASAASRESNSTITCAYFPSSKVQTVCLNGGSAAVVVGRRVLTGDGPKDSRPWCIAYDSCLRRSPEEKFVNCPAASKTSSAYLRTAKLTAAG